MDSPILPTIVAEAASRFGDRAALVAPDGWSLDYASLHARSDEVAAGLAIRGLGEGDVIALVLPSTPDYVVAYMAAAKLGAITAGVNPRYTPHERATVLEVASPRMILATSELMDGADTTDGELINVHRAKWADDILIELAVPNARPAPLAGDSERLVSIIFTSGTTGTPKGAMFGDREIDAISRLDVPGWDDDDIWGTGGAALAATQFAHIGFMTKLAWYLKLGTTTHILNRWRPREVLQALTQHRIAMVGGVAPQLALLLRDPTFDDYDLSAVETIIMGGAFSPPSLVKEARERFGAKYSIRYSSTESGGLGTATAWDAPEDEALYTIGRPRPGVEAAVLDPEDRPVADGAIGELCLRSPGVMRGYWNDPVATADAVRDGWLHTGDLAYVDDAGCLRLAGRSKEMFVRGGYNVYPVEVEAILSSHPGVADAALVPRPDAVMGEIGVAVIVPRDPAAPPSLESLREFCAAKLAAYKLPEAVRVVAELPLTPMQKIDRRTLARNESAEAAAGSAAEPVADPAAGPSDDPVDEKSRP